MGGRGSGGEEEEVEWREKKWSGGRRSGVEAEEAEWGRRRWSGGGGSRRWLEVGREGEGRSYHDITPLLCRYVSEWCGISMMSEVVQGGQSGSRGGVGGIRGLEWEFLYSSWGMDLCVRGPKVFRVVPPNELSHTLSPPLSSGAFWRLWS